MKLSKVLTRICVALVMGTAAGAVRASMDSEISFPVGEATGWIRDISDPGVGSVEFIKGTETPSSVEVEIFKTHDKYQDSGGPPGPLGLPVTFEIVLPSASQAGPIGGPFSVKILSEMVTNNTGVDWLDYELVVLTGGASVTTSGELITTGCPLPQTQDLAPMGVRFYGGVFADGVTDNLFYGSVSQGLPRLEIELGDDPITVLIKQRPSVPEPATMGLLGAGVAALVAARRRRRRRS
jgi:hypothetical protein